jgi:S1-C subfamily serine protease
VYVYGFPLGGILATTGNFTSGAITATAGMADDTRMLQISAPVQPGNSGGPVKDQNGNIVGVVVSKLNALRIAQVTNDVPQNVNFAIKAYIAINFLDSNGVNAATASGGKALDPADIADEAKKYTVRVTCE